MNYWIQTGGAEADVDFDKEKQTISLSTNLYPDYLIFEGTFREGGPYPSAPEPQPIEQKTLSLIPTNSNYKHNQKGMITKIPITTTNCFIFRVYKFLFKTFFHSKSSNLTGSFFFLITLLIIKNAMIAPTIVQPIPNKNIPSP